MVCVCVCVLKGNKPIPLTLSLSITKAFQSLPERHWRNLPLNLSVSVLFESISQCAAVSCKGTAVHPLTASLVTVVTQSQWKWVSVWVPYTSSDGKGVKEHGKAIWGLQSCSGLGDYLSKSMVLISITCSMPHVHTAAASISATTSSSASKL